MIIVTKEVIITKMGKIQFKIKIIQLQHQSEGILGQIEGIPEGGTERKVDKNVQKKATLSNLKNYYAYIHYLIIPNKWYFVSKVDSVFKSIYLLLGRDFTYDLLVVIK